MCSSSREKVVVYIIVCVFFLIAAAEKKFPQCNDSSAGGDVPHCKQNEWRMVGVERGALCVCVCVCVCSLGGKPSSSG